MCNSVVVFDQGNLLLSLFCCFDARFIIIVLLSDLGQQCFAVVGCGELFYFYHTVCARAEGSLGQVT